MFQLTENEFENLRCKNFTSSWGGSRYLPNAFTEQGIYMLMTVLRGELAIRQSRALIRTFKQMKDFIIENQDFNWAVEKATKKKKLDCSSAEFLTVDEGLCVQIMHLGAFGDEPATVALMDKYLDENGYVNDITDTRHHHEIYMSDARKVDPGKWKTVIRHPIRKI